MKRITIFGFIIIILLTSVLIYQKFDSSKQELTDTTVTQTWKEQHKLEQLAQMENEAAKDNNDSSETTTDKTPDYTKMFPDLYTEYALHTKATKGEKIAYLTFDDGPSKNTFKVLDILEELDIKATFFIVGREINEEGEDCLKRMVNEGHTIGIHTYSHRCNEIYCSIERYLDDFNTVYQQIHEITGERVNIYRFPWGSNNDYSKNIKDALMEEMDRRGFTCYDWNVDSTDSIGKPSAAKILKNIRKDVKRQEQPIILMHDSKINDLTVRLLPDIIKMVSEMGYKFDTLDSREPYQFPW